MILIDNALKKRQASGNPIRVGMVGAGFMGRGVALQICRYVPGMVLAAIANRTLAQARRAYTEAGEHDVRTVHTLDKLEDCIRRGQPAVTDDALLLSRAAGLDVIIEFRAGWRWRGFRSMRRAACTCSKPRMWLRLLRNSPRAGSF